MYFNVILFTVYAESNNDAGTLPPIAFIPQQQQTQSLPIFTQNEDKLNTYSTSGLRDFFEEAQQKEQQTKQQRINEEFVQPGPNYISHQVPFLKLGINEDEEKSASRDDVERIPPKPNKPKKDTETEDDKVFKLPDYDYTSALTSGKTPVNYNIGKSSSTVSQYPTAAGILKSSKDSLSPYRKYSFQPVTEAASVFIPKLDQALLSTLAPFNPTYGKSREPIETHSSENSPASSRGCRKLVRPASDGLEQMNCFVCENEASKSKYTQCSYSAEKEPVGYYTANSEKYSVPSKEPHTFRYKRYTNKHDPYYEIRERSRKTFEEPTIPKEYNLGFYYDPEVYDGSSSELSYSERQTEELKKNPANCKKVEDKGMTCTICKDPKTGGNYEQCSYSSEPTEKKYAYVTEKKYDSEDEPEETRVSVSKSSPAKNESVEQQTALSSEIKPVTNNTELIEPHESRIAQLGSPRKRRENDHEEENKEETNDEESNAEDRKPNQKQKVEDDYLYDIPDHFAETVKSTSRLGHPDNQDTKDDKEDNTDESSEFDEYHFKLFPELKKNNQANAEEENEEEYHIPAATKHNVEEVLAEFTKKDRSACKKSEKNGMTCFLCVDKNKIQHEECMYVQESRPISSHVAYHEVKGLKQPEKQSEEPESHHDETKTQQVVVSPSKNPSTDVALNVAGTSSTINPYEKKAISVKRKRSIPEGKETQPTKQLTERENTKGASKNENEEPTLKTPTEFVVADEEGAFSAETKPVYSKTHGVELPRYMVEQSEFEKEFDLSASTF